MRQDIPVEAHQFTRLPEPLPAAAQEQLRRAVQLHHVGEDLAVRNLSRHLGEGAGDSFDMADCLIGGVGRSDPRGEVG